MKNPLLTLGVALAPPIALLFSVPIAAQGTADPVAQYLKAGFATYKGKMTITNDPNKPKIVVTSLNAWQQSAETDDYLGATIDKNTKETRYYVYQATKVMGDWAGYNVAQLNTPAGPQNVKVSFKDDKVLECTDQCAMQELGAFPVDRTLLDQYAGRTPPTDRLSWEMKSSKGQKDAPGMLSPGEIKAFLAEVDTQRSLK